MSPRVFLAALLAVALVAVGPARADVTLTISGVDHSVGSFSEGDITFVSFSKVADLVGGTLDWSLIGHEIVYTIDTIRFVFTLDSPYFLRNDSAFNMTYRAAYRDGHLFLPIQTFLPFYDEVTYQKISWDPGRRRIEVKSDYFNVTDLAVSAKANGILLELFLTGSMAYDVFVTEGNWINISIRDGRLDRARIESRQDSRFMYQLKTHQQAATGQVSIRLRRKIESWTHRLQTNPSRIQISIADPSFTPAVESSPTIGPDNKIDVIVIDAGHGGSDYGAIGQGGTREKDVALDIARELAKLIRKDKQFKVVMTRDRDSYVPLSERARIANEASCDLFISIHANASTKRHVRGWNVFFLAAAKNDSARAVAQFENSAFFRDSESSGGDGPIESGDNPILHIINDMLMTEFQVESHDLAMMLDREFRRTLDIPARGVDQAGFVVLNEVYAPSILVETAFISNRNEENLLKDRNYQRAVADAIYEAVKRFKAKYESQ